MNAIVQGEPNQPATKLDLKYVKMYSVFCNVWKTYFSTFFFAEYLRVGLAVDYDDVRRSSQHYCYMFSYPTMTQVELVGTWHS